MSFWVWPSPRITFDEPLAKLGLYVPEHLWAVKFKEEPVGQASQDLVNKLNKGLSTGQAAQAPAITNGVFVGH